MNGLEERAVVAASPPKGSFAVVAMRKGGAEEKEEGVVVREEIHSPPSPSPAPALAPAPAHSLSAALEEDDSIPLEINSSEPAEELQQSTLERNTSSNNLIPSSDSDGPAPAEEQNTEIISSTDTQLQALPLTTTEFDVVGHDDEEEEEEEIERPPTTTSEDVPMASPPPSPSPSPSNIDDSLLVSDQNGENENIPVVHSPPPPPPPANTITAPNVNLYSTLSSPLTSVEDHDLEGEIDEMSVAQDVTGIPVDVEAKEEGSPEKVESSMEYSASEYSSVDLNTNPKLLTTMPSVAAPLSTTAKQAIEAAGQKKNTKTEGSVDTHSTSNLIETSEGLLLPGRKKTLSHAQINTRDRTGRSVVFKYAGTGNYEAVEALLRNGASPHIRDHAGVTPLHEACLKGHAKVVELLLLYHADVDASGDAGDRPLHDAVGNLHVDVVLLLLRHGASLKEVNNNQKNAYQVAIQDLQQFEEDGDDYSLEKGKEIIKILENWQEMTVKVTERNADGQTQFHLACANGRSEEVISLLQYGADVNAADNSGFTPLHNASLAGNTEVVQILLNYSAYVEPVGFENETPLHDAVANGHYEVAKLLLQYGAEPFRQDKNGKVPKDLIPASDDGSILKLLNKPLEYWQPVKLPEYYARLLNNGSSIQFPVESMDLAASVKRDVSQNENFAWGGLPSAPVGTFQSSREEKKLQALWKTIAKGDGGEIAVDAKVAKSNDIHHPAKTIRQESSESLLKTSSSSPKIDGRKKRPVEPQPSTTQESNKKAKSEPKTNIATVAPAKEIIPPKEGKSKPKDSQASSDTRTKETVGHARQPVAAPEVVKRPVVVKQAPKVIEKPPPPVSKLHLAMAELQANETSLQPKKKKKLFNFAGYQAAGSDIATAGGESSTEVSSESVMDGELKAHIPPISTSSFEASSPASATIATISSAHSLLSGGVSNNTPSKLPDLVFPFLSGQLAAPELTKQAQQQQQQQHHLGPKINHIDKKAGAEKRLCLPLCAFVKPNTGQTYFKPLSTRRENLWGSLPKENHTKVFLDFQLAFSLGLKNGRELLEKYPQLHSRVLNTIEKTVLESSPAAYRILNTMTLVSDSTYAPKLVIDNVEVLKLSDVDIHIIFWSEELYQILNDQITEQERKEGGVALEWIQDLVWPVVEEEKAPRETYSQSKTYVHKLKRSRS